MVVDHQHVSCVAGLWKLKIDSAGVTVAQPGSLSRVARAQAQLAIRGLVRIGLRVDLRRRALGISAASRGPQSARRNERSRPTLVSRGRKCPGGGHHDGLVAQASRRFVFVGDQS